MPQRSRAQRLNGIFPLSYMGVVPVSPVNFVMDDRDPNINDSKNFYIGDLWLNIGTLPAIPPTTADLWMLVSLIGNNATWINFASGISALQSLTGNSGGPVAPDGADNINVVGDGIGITIVGNPATNTLTASLVGGGSAASSFPTDAGTATPAAGVLNIIAGVSSSNAGKTVQFAGFGNTVELSVSDGDNNTLVGLNSGQFLSPGVVGNTGLGAASLNSNSLGLSGSYNTAVGISAGGDITGSSFNTIIGARALMNGHPGDNNFVAGYQSAVNWTGGEDNNIIIANPGVPGDSDIIRIGTEGSQTEAFMAGIAGVSVANQLPVVINSVTGQLGTGGSSGADSFPTDSGTATPSAGVLNIIANNAALNAGSSVLFTGSGNTVLLNVTDANDNTIIGEGSGNLTLSSTKCSMIGTSCGTALTSGSSNIFIGNLVGSSVTTGSNNLIIGDAGNVSNLTGTSAIGGFIGIGSSGSGGTPFIHNFGGSGSGNVFVGYDSGSFDAGQSGSNLDNTAIGQLTLRLITTGTSNSCIGYQAGSALTSGSNNCLLGRDAGISYTGGESNNICIGIQGVAGESNKTKIGGIRGATTTNNDAVAVLIDSAGQLGTVSSSMRFKSNIEPMGSVSDRLMDIEPVTFSWKKDQNYVQQVGLIAEEVEQVFPELVVHDKEGLPETVKYHELPVLLLNELKKLAARVAELEKSLT